MGDTSTRARKERTPSPPPPPRPIPPPPELPASAYLLRPLIQAPSKGMSPLELFSPPPPAAGSAVWKSDAARFGALGGGVVCVLMSIACVIATSLRRRRQKHVEFTSTMTSP